jgi:hypothetical protein
MGIAGWIGGLVSVVGVVVLAASFMAPDQGRTTRTVVGWNVARVGSLLVLAAWFTFWLLPSLIPV